MDLNKIADELDAIQRRANGDMGSSTARTIIHHLRNGDLERAKTAWYVDGDKIRQYPEVEKFVIEHLGCRLHGVIGCDYWLCKEK